MIKYNNIKLVYTCPAAPILGIQLDRAYKILKRNGDLFITDGNTEIKIDEFLLKMLFTPQECEWTRVDFSEKTKTNKK